MSYFGSEGSTLFLRSRSGRIGQLVSGFGRSVCGGLCGKYGVALSISAGGGGKAPRFGPGGLLLVGRVSFISSYRRSVFPAPREQVQKRSWGMHLRLSETIAQILTCATLGFKAHQAD